MKEGYPDSFFGCIIHSFYLGYEIFVKELHKNISSPVQKADFFLHFHAFFTKTCKSIDVCLRVENHELQISKITIQFSKENCHSKMMITIYN